jgi:hypothetical protein
MGRPDVHYVSCDMLRAFRHGFEHIIGPWAMTQSAVSRIFVGRYGLHAFGIVGLNAVRHISLGVQFHPFLLSTDADAGALSMFARLVLFRTPGALR